VDDQIARSLHHDWQENADGTVTITTSQDVDAYLKSAAELRQIDGEIGRQMTRDEGMHHVGTIPPVIVQLWRDQGFDVLSPARSGMTPEEHQRELLKRLCGDFAMLNTSRFGRLT
jgi:hypothetical protein